MLANILGSDTLIVLVIAFVVLFGGSQLPKLAKNLGAASHELRKAQHEADTDPMGPGTAAPAPEVRVPAALPVTSADNAAELRQL
jgi:sec-independent protein translocase protein TatA